MTYMLANKHVHPDPIEDCQDRRYVHRYHVTFTTIIAALPAVAAAVQEAVFYDGAVTAACFFVIDKEPAPGPTRGTWLWHAVFERPDCESDYHTCYSNSGQDGSDAKAIEQLQGEIDEAIQGADDPLITNVTVIDRTTIPAPGPMVPWHEDTRALLLQKI